MKLSQAFVSLFLVATPGVWADHCEVAENCDVYNLHNGHLYNRMAAPFSWTEAKLAAEELFVGGVQGHLVTITSATENDFVEGLSNQCDCSNFAWIGATDEGLEGTWEWVTGEPFDYSKWGSMEPNNVGGAENYAIMNWISGDGEWNDVPVDWLVGIVAYIVEWDVSDTSIVIDGCDTQVNDVVIDAANAITLSVQINACADDANNHGAYVKCVKEAVYAAEGVSCNKAGDIMACAGGARFGKRRLGEQ